MSARRGTGSEFRPTAFASTQPLDRDALLSAPVRWPRPARLERPLRASGKRVQAGLRTLGLETVGDLLEHLPSDSREARTVAALGPGEQATVTVQVRSIAARPVRRRRMRPLVEAVVFDATGSMRATFFNQPWLVDRYEPGTRLVLHGKSDGRGRFTVSHHAPAQPGLTPFGARRGEAAAEPGSTGDSVSHYPAADGVTSTQLLTLVQAERAALADVVEILSGQSRAAEGLPDRAAALAAMHFPRDARDPEAGRRRLAFEELLLMQLLFLRRRSERRERAGAIALGEPPSLSARWRSGALPFELTGDQQRAIAQIDEDLSQPRPMQRLLMGDVGSGKTVVALHAMLRAVEHGHQAALMAPTETLAEQHFATVQRLLGGESVSAALLTGSTPAARRADTLAKLASGELSLIVGTHALIEPDVVFRSLALAVIDEQHRFGVRQRERLVHPKGRGDGEETVHTLHMTATPIPRTLSLARYGDVEVSTLHELPSGRRPVRTRIVGNEAERAAAYEDLRAQLARGRQAFVVCPLIEEDPESGGAEAEAAPGADGRAAMRAATAEFDRLRAGELEGYELALLHGAMRPREKQEAMEAFASGRVQVLVSTTVIEVGIDVQNATVMLIENAERFGISQLHQLRGRVGRGEHPAVCFLVGPAGAARLRALVAHADGFRLADIDLELRNEGELVGTRQSGQRQFRVARLPDDGPLLERARARAETIVAADPQLKAPEHALLADELARRFGALVGEPLAG
ncbi:MAG TPA: ATP-dependent DNA helicase RecG [Solirubrobacteraceae bacterium]|nr:ATP-dependent DNA helicase RecG [Solirubrobacteraceae bacterium]